MEADSGRQATQVALLLGAMAFLVPAVGATNEAILQDTLKSMLVAFFAIAASLVYFSPWRQSDVPLALHGSLWFPGILLAYAIGSVAWSHHFLGSVEAIRWCVFSLLLLLGTNVLTRERMAPIVWGIHLGAVTASLWTTLQFWFDLQLFAQGPNPASTFVNRNFFAEFAVSALPFSVLLLSRLKDKASVFLMAPSLGLNVLAILMTGTRSALLALMITAPLLLCIAWRCQRQWSSNGWHLRHRLCLLAVIVATVGTMGAIPTRNTKLLSESVQTTAIGRAFDRSTSIAKKDEYTKGSFSVRWSMWTATARMIRANPLLGVGAGAWEVHIAPYQASDQTLEADYYAHNEFLQLVAEYGVIGWLALLGLISYLVWATYQTWIHKSSAPEETLLRASALSSLLALFVVSCAGFPWRLAGTGCLFALNLALLAASDIRLAKGHTFLVLNLHPQQLQLAFAAATLGALATVGISVQAAICESKLTQAIQISLLVRGSENPNDKKWDSSKARMLELTRDGVAINPHYRKLTPIIGDALASWGDWSNAIWVWESVLQSRPLLVGMMTNIARGYLQTEKNPHKAQALIDRARLLQADSTTIHSLEVLLWSRFGKEHEAANRARELLRAGTFDLQLVNTAYLLGQQLHQPSLSILAVETGIRTWPQRAVDGWLKLGDVYASTELSNDNEALASYRKAIQLSSPTYRPAVRAAIPKKYRDQLP